MQHLLKGRAPILDVGRDHIFRKLFEASVEGIIILDKQGRIITANPSCLKMFRYKKNDLINHPIEMLFPQGYQIFYQPEEIKNNGVKTILDGLCASKDIFPVSISISKAVIDTEHLTIGFLVDVTEHIKAEQERIQFSRIFDEALNEIYILDHDSWKFLSVNKGALRHLGYTLEEMKSMTILDINPILNKKEIEALIYPLEAGIKNKIHFETFRQRKNGSIYPVEVHAQLTNYFSKKAYLVMATDITERKGIQQKIMKAVVNGQEKERKRIAKELHDGLGQYLSAVNFNLDTLGFSLKGDDENEKILNNIRMIIDNSVEELKAISRNLHPRILENQRLPRAVEALCETISTSPSNKLKIHLQIHDLDTRFPLYIEMGLYRVIQELLNNMLKHANANEVNLQLVRHKDSLLLLFEDDGVGFETFELNEFKFEGLGIRNIITQIKALNGTYHFDSCPGKGTSVTIEIPLP